MELDKVFNQDCLEYMKTLPDDCVDTIITSPPYAEQRTDTYGGIPESEYQEWFMGVAREIYRVLKPTGSFILNIKEHVNAGARSPYVYKLVLALSELFIWNDTFIWNKPNAFPSGNDKRLKDGFEYCYMFTKTKDYKFFPKNVLVRSKSYESEIRRTNKGVHNTNNKSGMNMSVRVANEYVRPSNVLEINAGCYGSDHPAAFPVDLPLFFIKLLTEEEDLVYDPFAGSGTTLYAAKQLERHFIGTEIMPEYIPIIENRLNQIDFGLKDFIS